jgi:YcaO-like protein with predicted kinase domain
VAFSHGAGKSREQGLSMSIMENFTPKGFRLGTERTRSPADTLAANRRFMPTMGITRLANITGLDRIGLPVVIAVRPNSRALATSQGKGASLEAAQASALMESIETWHAERIELPLRHESYHALSERARVIDPCTLPRRADAVYLQDRPIVWTEGIELFSDTPVYVPYETVNVNTVRQPGSVRQFVGSSNGLASGNHKVEAVIHATCEVIERDALSLWDLVPESLRQQRQVSTDSDFDPALRQLMEQLEAKGFVLGIWDITTDIGIPTYTCVLIEDSASNQWRSHQMFSGHGTHLSPEIALSRAIHEAIQSRLTAISGSRDDFLHSEYSRSSNPDDHAHMHAMITGKPCTRQFAAIRPPLADNFEADLATIMDKLRQAGIDSIVAVDLSRIDVGIPVVKMVIPGLEGPRLQAYSMGTRARRYQRNIAW